MEVKLNCKMKSDEYAERSATRAGEAEALTKAIEIIGGIKDKKTSADTYSGDTSFLQMHTSKTEMNINQVKNVLSYLRNEGKRQGSKKLQLLALKVAEGGRFDKITKMIS